MGASAADGSPKRLVTVVRSSACVLWVFILVLHVVAALGYWRPERPPGFPVLHPRFWSHQVLPWAVTATCLGCLASLFLRRARWFRAGIWSFPAAYLGVAVAARVIFPISSRTDLSRLLRMPGAFRWGLWLPLLVWAVVLGGLAALAGLRRPRRVGWSVAAGAFGLCVGVLVVWSHRADAPSTIPLAERMPATDAPRQGRLPGVPELPADMSIHPEREAVEITCGDVKILVKPLLTFNTRSPDRCWTALADRQALHPVVRLSPKAFHDGAGTYVLYAGDEPASLHVAARKEGQPLHLEAWTFLPQPVYSHGNAFCRVTIRGYGRLSLSFSPLPQHAMGLERHSDPEAYMESAGFGYLGADGRFHWAKGRDEDKGPFTEVAAGPLPRDAPLAMTILDDGAPIGRITLDDWASQLGLGTSPTAGWGLPVNAIVPFVGPRQYGSEVEIRFQLAASGVGWGYDSVGHRAGAYRNRMTIEPLAADERD